MKNLIIGAIALTALLSGCKKDNKKEATPQPETTTNYYKLAVGNYWIYERWTIDTNGLATNSGFVDSVYVFADTIINGNTYFDYRSPLTVGNFNFIRDSSGFLVGLGGGIIAAPNSYSGVFATHYVTINADTAAIGTHTMTSALQNITVPAGAYATTKVNAAYLFIPPFDVTLNNGPNPKINNDYYADGVGKVQFSYYYTSTPNKIENRLLRYHVQ